MRTSPAHPALLLATCPASAHAVTPNANPQAPQPSTTTRITTTRVLRNGQQVRFCPPHTP